MSADLVDMTASMSTGLQISRRVERRIIRRLLRRPAGHAAAATARRLVALAAPGAVLPALLLWPPELLWAALASALVVSLGLR